MVIGTFPNEGQSTVAPSSRPSTTVVGIAGSLRRASFNRGLLRAAVDLAPARMRLVIHDLAAIPMFNAVWSRR